MTMIKCGECGARVSSQASACPKCGAPISAAAGGQAAGNGLTTIQETAKGLKLHTLGATVAFWGGLLFFVVAAQGRAEGEEPSAVPILVSAAGFFWWLITRARIWWHHK